MMNDLFEHNRSMDDKTPHTTTADSRFHADCYRSGMRKFFGMYSGNITVEGDGLAYPELNVLRALIVEPFVVLVIYSSSLMAYIGAMQRDMPRLLHRWRFVLEMVAVSLLDFVVLLHIIRIVFTICCLALELCLWPLRVLLGQFFAPITASFSAGHLYALSYQSFIRSGCTTRRINVKNLNRSLGNKNESVKKVI